MGAVVNFDKMKVGRKSDGRHWTKVEVESRKAAAQKLTRAKPKLPKPPKWVREDADVYRIWKAVIKSIKGLELLDVADAHALATYCKLEVDKENAAVAGNVAMYDRLAKTSLTYAKSLGLTPEARARLARRRAENEIDPNGDLFE